MPDFPKPMRRKGRAADQNFSQEEKFFRRIPPALVAPDGKMDIRAFEFPDISVNREKFDGRPEYVLWESPNRYRADWKIAFSQVKHIPPTLEEDGLHFSFAIAHAPSKRNFFHSEIRCFNNAGCHIDPRSQLSMVNQFRWRKTLLKNMSLHN